MRQLRGVGPAAVGFAVAIVVTVVLVWIDPASEVPGLDQAAPREIPLAVVGPTPDAQTMRDALNGPSDHPVAARLSPSREVARDGLRSREISAVLLMGDGAHHELWVASAGGAPEARKVRRVVTEILSVSGQSVTVSDVIPVSSSDPHGVGPFRLGTAWSILGVAFAALLSAIYGARSPGPRLAVRRCAGLAAGACVAGVGGAMLSVVLLDRFEAPFWPLAALGALIVLGVGAMTLGLIAWFGRVGLGLAILGLVIGVPGAIGAWPLTPLPTVWPTIVAWLPPGASTWAIRGLAHFEADGVPRVVWMALMWTTVGLGAMLVAADTGEGRSGTRGRHPVLRRRPVVATSTALAAFALVVVLPAARAFTTEDLDPSLEVTCQAFRHPTSVEELNHQIQTVSDVSGFVGGDVGASTTLADGRRLFVFGDTLREPGYGSQSMVRNSMLVFDDNCAGILQRRDRGAVIPSRADGVGYWPMSIAAVEIHGRDLVGVMAQRVERADDEPLEFRNLGPAIAIFRVERGEPPVLQRVLDMGRDDPDRSRPTWGAAATVVRDVVYVYGTSRTTPGFGWGVSVARVKLESFADQSAWRYWDGRSWQREASRAATLIDQDEGVSQTFSVFRDGSTWYALSKRDDFVGRDLVVWTAPGPTGPFTASAPLAQIPSTAEELRYMPLAHPDLLPETGTMIVSVSRNTSDPDAILADPSLYRPEFLRVTLPR